MKRRFYAALVIAALAMVVPGSMTGHASAQQKYTLRMATLAPQGSSWMRIFQAWNQSLKKATQGRLQFHFYAGGAAGDEKDFVRKMRAGQMDGAAVTSTGLGLIVPKVLVLAAPGLFRKYDALDRARAALSSDFEKQFMDNGYKLLGWGDVGMAHLFSDARPILKPSDLKEVRPWAWRDDVLFTETLKVIGANGVPLALPEVYPALQTGMVDTVPSSAIAAVALQWYTRLKWVTKNDLSILIGATVLRKDKYEALPPDLRAALDATSVKAHKALKVVIRRDDARSYKTMIAHGMKEVDGAAYMKQWEAVGLKVRNNLVGRLYPASLLKKVERLAGG